MPGTARPATLPPAVDGPAHPPPAGAGPTAIPVRVVYDASTRAPQMWLRIPLERPLFTYILLATIAVIFVLMTLSGGSLNATEQERLLVMWGAKVNWLIAAGQWWRLISATFLHAGFLHIALNGYALFLIGTDLEALVGRARFAAIYFISGLAGSVASFTFSSMTGVGASGAIFGLIGALAVYYGLHRRLFGRVGQIQFWNIIAVIVLNVAFGFSGILPVDNSAHLGGLAAGMAVGYVLCPRYRPGRWLSPYLREVVNVNRGFLPWVAATLIAVDVVLMFVISLMLYRMGINLYLY